MASPGGDHIRPDNKRNALPLDHITPANLYVTKQLRKQEPFRGRNKLISPMKSGKDAGRRRQFVT
jgi:hypothetical protein